MALLADLHTLYRMALAPVRGATHAERMQSFYGAQAANYDSFRERLLSGRKELWQALEVPQGGTWIDVGGGTGANLEALGDRIGELARIEIVDLAEPLLNVARQRAAERHWRNVHCVTADATQYDPLAPVDVVTFSYSLTMIPDWFAAIDRAAGWLKSGGTIGVVDFHVARRFPIAGGARQGWMTRAFWPLWFARDNVQLSPDHVSYLLRRFEVVTYKEGWGKIPYLPLVRVPYYLFVGRKAHDSATHA